MEIKSIITYPINIIKRTWLGDFAKLVRIAFTPLKEVKAVKTDSYVPSFRKPTLSEAKAGIKRVTTAKRFREMKKKILEGAAKAQEIGKGN